MSSGPVRFGGRRDIPDILRGKRMEEVSISL
jgi:hypothetical protein